MAVPDFQSLMLPLLAHVADGQEYTIAGSRDFLAIQFGLSDEERKQRLPSGAANTFYNRLAWAKTYLKRAGLIAKTRRGVFTISPRGHEVLSNPPERITIGFLHQFPEFCEFRQKPPSTDNGSAITVPDVEADATPEEALENAYERLRDELAAEVLSHVRNAHPSFLEQLVVDLMLNEVAPEMMPVMSRHMAATAVLTES